MRELVAGYVCKFPQIGSPTNILHWLLNRCAQLSFDFTLARSLRREPARPFHGHDDSVIFCKQFRNSFDNSKTKTLPNGCNVFLSCSV
jgi:hypothetical protein